MLAKNLVFNLIGHINHWVFCPNMPPGGDDKLDGELAAATEEHSGPLMGFHGT